jgi:5-methylcytosine-specific restriction endonuclease McrBC regulatory subunit McrC
VLATAIDRLRRQRIDASGVADRLRQAAASLTGVSMLRDPLAALSRERATPRPYRDALALARLVLDSRTLVPVANDHRGAQLLFRMPAVWEAFVEARLAPLVPAGHRLASQHPIPLTDTGPSMTAAADLVELDALGGVVHVIDAKYTRYRSPPSADHLYQVYTYARRLGARRASLVHPGSGQRDELTVGDVRIATLGLDTSPDVVG